MPRRMVPIMEEPNVSEHEIIETTESEAQCGFGNNNIWIWIIIIVVILFIFGGFHY